MAGKIGVMLVGIFTVSFAGRIAYKAIQKINMEGSKMGWRKLMLKYPGGFDEVMSKAEASKILNIGKNSTEEEIKIAHRKMMKLNHPDKGGSQYISVKINEAKSVLLENKSFNDKNTF
eukprot:TRINITY_DN12765_c0_g1_i1.p1 TRINITY_DN12765_c0_g1~~TRINITY_DN12765_c0_g1_i1.p1  ORF type:complete len:118 (+),score=28.17 TRINITY_DN12765_c0_g1_i1:42-395(+)